MATLLDVTLLGGAKVVFTFLLVYIIVWGLLVWIKPFGKEVPTGPYAVIALVAAFFTLVSGTVRYLIEYVTPWFLFLVIFLFFVLFVIRIFGVSEGDLRGIIGNSTVHIMIIVIILIIMLFGLGSAFGQKSLEATQGEQQGTYYNPAGYYDAQDVGIGETPSGGGASAVQPLTPGQDLNYPANMAPQPGQPGATATGSFSLNVVNTLLHPKVMALIAVILIAVVAVWLMSRPDWV